MAEKNVFVPSACFASLFTAPIKSRWCPEGIMSAAANVMMSWFRKGHHSLMGATAAGGLPAISPEPSEPQSMAITLCSMDRA